MLARRFSHDTNQYVKKIRPMKGPERSNTFIRGKKLSIGIQLMKKGDEYGEPAHHNGEVYFILKGHAKLRIGKKEFKASPGMALYVPSRVRHKFYDVKKEFVFLFIFAGLDTSLD